jgi:hypothetical protein
VPARVVCLYRAESAYADMQRNEASIYTAAAEFVKQTVREMQAGGRGGDRAGTGGVDGLVHLRVKLVPLALHVVRERDTAVTVNHIIKIISAGNETDKALVTVIHNLVDTDFYLPAFVNRQYRSNGRAPGRFDQCPPTAAVCPLRKKKLRLRAGRILAAKNSGGDHARIVKYQPVPFPEYAEYIPEREVLY